MKISAFSKTYEDRRVLDFPGMELTPGKIHAIIGANGSGKSTFAKILAGTIPADKRGRHTEGGTVGFMPQKNYAFRMSTRDNLLLNGKDPARAERLMDAIQIRHLENKRADKLSGGETARMALARLMMKQYDLVVLDEPTAAMDMETTLLSEKLITEYVKETGCALVLVTHSLQQARRIYDEVWYFHKGKLLETDP
jgi:ABC-type Mn2+/Zn2+ transport system ATPase subunit